MATQRAGNVDLRRVAGDALERAYEQKDPAMIEVYGNPFLDNLADDPRFAAFLRKMKLPEWPRT